MIVTTSLFCEKNGEREKIPGNQGEAMEKEQKQGKWAGKAAIKGIAVVSSETKDACDTNPVVLMGGVDAVKICEGEDVFHPFDTVVPLSRVQVIDNTFLRCIAPLSPGENLLKDQGRERETP